MDGTYSKKNYVREYYGNELDSLQDLKTGACSCSETQKPPFIKEIESDIDPEIMTRFYGCGSPVPPALAGRKILDLGCGTGRDVYVASRLAGPEGFVTGVDMTDKQLEIARRHIEPQMEKSGYSEPNVAFKKGYIENLKEAGIEDASVDVVMSNCVINLSQNKKRVFSEIFRVLKPGGELYFSDVFSGRRVPHDIADDPLLHSECLGGAMYIEDFRRIMRDAGCPDYRVTARHRIRIDNPDIEVMAGMVDFYSMTIRVFKLDSLEDVCEDYGQVAVYRGTIPGYVHTFELDDHHRFITGKPMLVCGNTASMLSETRYSEHFRVTGDRSVHYGPFQCAPAYEKSGSEDESGGACC